MNSIKAVMIVLFVCGFIALSAAEQINSNQTPSYTFPITGKGFAIQAFEAGSSASGGNFDFSNTWYDYSIYLGWCTIGQQCGVPGVGLVNYWLWNQSPSCLGLTCTIYLSGEGTEIEGSFIPPATASSVEVQVPITVKGEVGGWYSGHNGMYLSGWQLWDVTFTGKGTAVVDLVWLGFGDQLEITSFTYSFAGKATAHPLVSAISTPGQQPTGVSFIGQYLYESEQGALGAINQLDTRTGQVLRSFLSPSTTGFDGRSTPSDLTSINGHFFMTDVGTAGTGSVYEFDPTASTTFNSFSVPFRGGAITADKARLFIGDLDSTRLLVTSHSGKPIRSLSTTFNPAGVVFDPTDNLLWIVDHTQPMKIWQATTKGVPIRSCSGPWNPDAPVSYSQDIQAVDGLGGIALHGSSLYVAEVGGYQWWEWGVEPGTISIVDSRNLSCSPALPTRVRLDVKPGSFPNVVNVNSNGMLPMTILSTAKFDATQIDPTTVRFGDTGTEATPNHWSLADVNGDGLSDLQMNFDVQQTGIACDTTLVSMTAKTYGGNEIRGTDSVKVIGCR
ncbi:MAG TPA: hypothetical protein VF011_18920 [Terriglobales bacterium]